MGGGVNKIQHIHFVVHLTCLYVLLTQLSIILVKRELMNNLLLEFGTVKHVDTRILG